MSYTVKEIFYSIQGEGAHSGRAAVFVRFTGCNGWSGRQKDRKHGPLPCSAWCDTDFVGGRKMTAEQITDEVESLFTSRVMRHVVLTGGEPALQLDGAILKRLLDVAALVSIETNGTLPLPELALTRCWITLSPKTEKVVQDRVSELKLVYPTIPPEAFDYITTPFRFLQPLDAGFGSTNMAAAYEYVLKNPQWKLSLQTHKILGVR